MPDTRSADTPALDATKIVDTLNRHGVQYVVVGAFAAIAQQAPIPATRDIDLTPETSPENLTRLSAALNELDARVRTGLVPHGLLFDDDGSSLRSAAVWNLACPYGEFDISFQPAGFERGYADLEGRAHRVSIEGVVVRVADLADVIRSKEAAGRPKDVQVLPALYRHLAQLRGTSDDDAA